MCLNPKYLSINCPNVQFLDCIVVSEQFYLYFTMAEYELSEMRKFFINSICDPVQSEGSIPRVFA